MEKLDLIKKWANENGYEVEHSSPIYIILTKVYKDVGDTESIKQIINIDLFFDNFDSRIGLKESYYSGKDQLEELFIPFNRVKRDEKLLREYLKDE